MYTDDKARPGKAPAAKAKAKMKPKSPKKVEAEKKSPKKVEAEKAEKAESQESLLFLPATEHLPPHNRLAAPPESPLLKFWIVCAFIGAWAPRSCHWHFRNSSLRACGEQILLVCGVCLCGNFMCLCILLSFCVVVALSRQPLQCQNLTLHFLYAYKYVQMYTTCVGTVSTCNGVAWNLSIVFSFCVGGFKDCISIYIYTYMYM